MEALIVLAFAMLKGASLVGSVVAGNYIYAHFTKED